MSFIRPCRCCGHIMPYPRTTYCDSCVLVFQEFLRPFVRRARCKIYQTYGHAARGVLRVFMDSWFCGIHIMSENEDYNTAFMDLLLLECGMDNHEIDDYVPVDYKYTSIEFAGCDDQETYFGPELTLYFDLSRHRDTLYINTLRYVFNNPPNNLDHLPSDIVNDICDLNHVFAVRYLFTDT